MSDVIRYCTAHDAPFPSMKGLDYLPDQCWRRLPLDDLGECVPVIYRLIPETAITDVTFTFRMAIPLRKGYRVLIVEDDDE